MNVLRFFISSLLNHNVGDNHHDNLFCDFYKYKLLITNSMCTTSCKKILFNMNLIIKLKFLLLYFIASIIFYIFIRVYIFVPLLVHMLK